MNLDKILPAIVSYHRSDILLIDPKDDNVSIDEISFMINKKVIVYMSVYQASWKRIGDTNVFIGGSGIHYLILIQMVKEIQKQNNFCFSFLVCTPHYAYG